MANEVRILKNSDNNPSEDVALDTPEIGEVSLDDSLAARARRMISIGGAVASLAFQQSPGNEVLRGYVGLAALERTGSPAVAAVAVGLSTFAIESATGSAVANSFRAYSDKIHGFKEKMKTRFNRSKTEQDLSEKNNFLSDSVLALTVGSAAVVVRKHLAEKNRTLLQDTLTVVGASAGISVASGALGYVGLKSLDEARGSRFSHIMEKVVDLGTDWKTYIAVGGIWAALKLRKKLGKQETIREESIDTEDLIEKTELYDYDRDTGLLSVRIDDLDSKEAGIALDFEQKIWTKKDYGSLEEYNQKYKNQTRLFACFKDGKCIGTTRIFTKSDSGELAPFISEMTYSDPEGKARIIESFEAGEIEELGTSAFENLSDLRGAIKNLWRLAYRDGASRGVKGWGIIMEPPRVKFLSRFNKFTFSQVGDAIDYQGGDCAPHLMFFDECIDNMHTQDPRLKQWFVDQSLRQ
jgi:hypothetical protein